MFDARLILKVVVLVQNGGQHSTIVPEHNTTTFK